MTKVSVREARSNLRELIAKAGSGEEVVLTRRGKEVARIVPPRRRPKPFPDLSQFREAMIKRGAKVTGNTVAEMRKEERY
ncbi:MAG: type II toxin-antitoxin system prevent-host-death family antitoxin [Planctomycetes bacterium]|nr:type II toxin-antitoxin system prevent-host-death family antitoxin [Planctomycetota bacterium]